MARNGTQCLSERICSTSSTSESTLVFPNSKRFNGSDAARNGFHPNAWVFLTVPELPEVETVRRGLVNRLVGRVISRVEVRRDNLRFPFPERMAERMEGRKIEGIDRRAKYLLARLDDGTSWLIHLGMSGKFTLFEAGEEPSEVGKHDHFAMWLDDGGQAIYTDPRRFGVMDLVDTDVANRHRLLSGLGLEPLSDDFDAVAFCELLRGRRTPMKSALLDQRLVAGLGNIYVCEILSRAGVSPKRSAASVGGAGPSPTLRGERLVTATKQVLEEAIEAGGSSISDFANVEGDLGYFSHSFRVYGREGMACLRQGCSGKISRIVQSGRSTFYCPRCQR